MSAEVIDEKGVPCSCGGGVFASGPRCGACGGLSPFGVSLVAAAKATLRVVVSESDFDYLWYAEGIDIWLTASGETQEAAQAEFLRAVKRSADLTMQEFGSVEGLLGDMTFRGKMASRMAQDLYPRFVSEPFAHEHLPFSSVMWLYEE